MTDQRIVFVRIEPTGYVLDLLRALREIWPGEIDAHFTSSSATQPWEFDAKTNSASLLPPDPSEAKRTIRAAILQAPKPALVHTAGWGAPACQAAISAAFSKAIPVVAEHDTWADAATGLSAVAKRLVLPRRLAKITHFASGGERQAAFLRRYGVGHDKITPVNMTVDVLRIQRYLSANAEAGGAFRARYTIPENAKVVLFLSRLVEGKGLEDLLAAWTAIKETHEDIHLVIAGDGPLMTLAKTHADERTHAVGRLSGDSVWDAYAAADIFAAPSHSEGWGLTINEAMAASVPVLMSDAFGCIGDLAIDGETAFIARARDPQDLQLRLETLLSSETARETLREGADKVIAKWTIEHQAERIVEVWKRCLADA